MNLYLGTVDVWFDMRDGKGSQCETRRVLVEAENITAAYNVAEATIDANTMINPMHIVCKRIHRVTLPAELSCAHAQNSLQEKPHGD